MFISPADITYAHMSEAGSAPQSHSSSFDGSLASQNSTGEPLSTDVARPSKDASAGEMTTPPTTTSNFSSQESPAHKPRGSPFQPSSLSRVSDAAARLEPSSTDANGVHKPHARSSAAGNIGTIPSKRLANGEIKTGEKSRSISPPNPERYNHLRTASLNSKDNAIREVGGF